MARSICYTSVILYFLQCYILQFYSVQAETIYHNEFALHIPTGPKSADRIASKHGYINTGQIGSLENFYLFQHKRIHKRSLQPAQEHHLALNEEPEVLWVEQQTEKKRSKRDFVEPDEQSDAILKTQIRDPRQFFSSFGGGLSRFNFFSPSVRIPPTRRGSGRFPDPLYGHQWYLTEGASDGNDMNVMPAWSKGYTGKGVVVSILDDGIQHTHPDLKLNYDPLASTDINSNDPDPMPRDNGDNKHGTRCAGEVASVAFNDICGVGVAYNASIGGVRMLDGTVNDAVEARAISLNPDHIDIYSASWGPEDDGKTVDGPGPLAKRAFINGVIRGRHGKGSIFVWASGNGGRHTDNCNCDGYTNSIFTLSISSASQRGFKPWYLEECSSTLASTYSSGTPGLDQSVATADMDGALRPDRICTVDHTGTSASAPLAAGLCALALEANPDLTWRDMQHIVVRTSRHEPLKHEDGWFVNAVGRHVSHKFGYGLMDAGAMVDLASKWTTVAPQHVCQTVIQRSEQTIPTILGSSVTSDITTDGCAGTTGEVRYLEHVQAMVSLRFLPRGNINIKLTSPSGTTSTVLFERPRDVLSEKFDDWPFLSVHFWGEKAAGTWKLHVTNSGSRPVKEPGVLLHWQLILHGTKDHPGRLRVPPVSFAPNRFGDIAFSGSVNHETKEQLVSVVNDKTADTAETWYTNSTLIKAETCHSECFAGCHGPGPTNCRKCRHFSFQGECVHTCPAGTYGSEGKDCLPCHGSCAECIGPRQNQCSSCSHSTFIPHLGLCVDTCPDGYFPEQGLCQPCSNLCAQCNSTSNCFRCEHHLLLYNGTCQATCPPNFYEDPYYSCAFCDSTCKTCIGPKNNECASCNRGYYLHNGSCRINCPEGTFGDEETGQCYLCPIGCKSCGKSSCTVCIDGWRKKMGRCVAYRDRRCEIGSFSDNTGICRKCHSTCMNCIGPTETDCTQCQDNYTRYGSRCVMKCPTGFFKYRDICLPCSPGCSECKSFSSCNVCLPKYQLFDQTCRVGCPLGHYTDRQKCYRCYPTCTSCWGPNSNQCLTCDKKLVLFNSECRRQCPSNQYRKDGSCLPCYHNCKTCNGSGLYSCTSCKDMLTLEEGICLECRTGQYYNKTLQACAPCHDTCLSCTHSSMNSCSSCQAPLSLHSATLSCRRCCKDNTSDESSGECCKCDPLSGRCYGALTADKRRIASNPPVLSFYKNKEAHVWSSTLPIVLAVILVNILLFIVIFSMLRITCRNERRYSYQRLTSRSNKLSQHILLNPVDGDTVSSDDDTQYSVVYTKT